MAKGRIWGAMDKDVQPQAEGDLADARRQEEIEDLNLSAAGFVTGKASIHQATMARDKEFQAEQKQKKERSKLESLLLDAQYRAAYDAAIDAFNEAQNAIYEALIKSNNELNAAKQCHNQVMDNANIHGDGRKVFMDDDGNAYTEDGQKLTDEEMLDVDWREGSPGWDEYIQSRDDLAQKQKRFDTVNGHQKRLDSIDSELNNKGDPPTVERLGELKDELNSITTNLQNGNQKTEYSAKHVSVENVPDLQL